MFLISCLSNLGESLTYCFKRPIFIKCFLILMSPVCSYSYDKSATASKFDELSQRIAASRERLMKLSRRAGVDESDLSYSPKPSSREFSNQSSRTYNPSNRSFENILKSLDEVVRELGYLQDSYQGSKQISYSAESSSYPEDNFSPDYVESNDASTNQADQGYWDNYDAEVEPVSVSNSLVSSNYWSIGYSNVSQDFQEHQWSSNQLSFYGTSNINNYFTGYGSFFIGKGDYIDAEGNDFVDLLNWEYGFSGGVQLHFDLISGRLKPFIGADLGFEYSFAKAIASIDSDSISFGWGFIWGINLGTEVKIGDKFSIVPQLRIQDVEPTTIYGIDLAYFFSESWALNSGFMLGGDYSKFDFSVLFTY
jgi:hypothetical protein